MQFVLASDPRPALEPFVIGVGDGLGLGVHRTRRRGILRVDLYVSEL
jgi:hypothetical protein